MKFTGVFFKFQLSLTTFVSYRILFVSSTCDAGYDTNFFLSALKKRRKLLLTFFFGVCVLVSAIDDFQKPCLLGLIARRSARGALPFEGPLQTDRRRPFTYSTLHYYYVWGSRRLDRNLLLLHGDTRRCSSICFLIVLVVTVEMVRGDPTWSSTRWWPPHPLLPSSLRRHPGIRGGGFVLSAHTFIYLSISISGESG